MKSLNAVDHPLAATNYQLKVLSNTNGIRFYEKLKDHQLFPLKPTGIEVFQVNLGKMCNQTCKHCHVDAGPDRKEIMSKETLKKCLTILSDNDIPIVDLTGGAPEMNPHFRWYVEELFKLNKKILVRCNLTIILANKKYADLPEFFAKHNVEVISSLPHYTSGKTDKQRGDGVFEKSIEALKLLNKVGYGKDGTGLTLNLVYNPNGAFLPASQNGLEQDFKRNLKDKFDIEFNNLFVITNIPVSRFLDYLLKSENYEQYMEKLISAFNPLAAQNVMCRNTVSISWDGFIYDCDFNQMLDLKVTPEALQHIDTFDLNGLAKRSIIVNQHCYGCTAGAGSSCGGEVV